MHRTHLFAASLLCLGSLAAAVSASAQQETQPQPPQVMGTVATHDALVGGGLAVRNELAELVSNASVTAYDRTATISLSRGGQVLVCATSQFHLLHSGGGKSLLFGLDRGALEIHGAAQPQDVILTPDLRFTIEAPGSFDLQLRVTRDGDTCVQNAGSRAPVLTLSDAFSPASYRLLPGQHVLFEHGDLHEVVDKEQSSCGCPPPVAASASGAHPFPAAASEGLVPEPPPANSAPAGEKHTQVSATLAYPEGQEGPGASPASGPLHGSGAAGSGSAEPPPTPPGAHAVFHSIGRFFHRLFHPRSSHASSGS